MKTAQRKTAFLMFRSTCSEKARSSELGASLVEYALLISLIAVMGIASVQTLGENIVDSFDRSANAIQGAGGIDDCGGWGQPEC